MMKWFLRITWFVILMWLTTCTFGMISMPSSADNLMGLFLLIIFAFISIKTRCFTILKFKKNEKDF